MVVFRDPILVATLATAGFAVWWFNAVVIKGILRHWIQGDGGTVSLWIVGVFFVGILSLAVGNAIARPDPLGARMADKTLDTDFAIALLELEQRITPPSRVVESPEFTIRTNEWHFTDATQALLTIENTGLEPIIVTGKLEVLSGNQPNINTGVIFSLPWLSTYQEKMILQPGSVSNLSLAAFTLVPGWYVPSVGQYVAARACLIVLTRDLYDKYWKYGCRWGWLGQFDSSPEVMVEVTIIASSLANLQQTATATRQYLVGNGTTIRTIRLTEILSPEVGESP